MEFDVDCVCVVVASSLGVVGEGEDALGGEFFEVVVGASSLECVFVVVVGYCLVSVVDCFCSGWEFVVDGKDGDGK